MYTYNMYVYYAKYLLNVVIKHSLTLNHFISFPINTYNTLYNLY